MLYIHRLDSRAQIAFCYTQDENCFPRQCYGEDNNFIKGNSKTNSSRESIYNIDRFFFLTLKFFLFCNVSVFHEPVGNLCWQSRSVSRNVIRSRISTEISTNMHISRFIGWLIKWQSCISKLHPKFLCNYNGVITVQHYTELPTFSSSRPTFNFFLTAQSIGITITPGINIGSYSIYI